jgi:hypothetical protein
VVRGKDITCGEKCSEENERIKNRLYLRKCRAANRDKYREYGRNWYSNLSPNKKQNVLHKAWLYSREKVKQKREYDALYRSKNRARIYRRQSAWSKSNPAVANRQRRIRPFLSTVRFFQTLNLTSQLQQTNHT